MSTHDAIAERLIPSVLRVDEILAQGAVGDPAGPLDPSDHPWSAAITAALPAVQRELQALLDAGRTIPSTDEVAGSPQAGDGEWSSYVLSWYGADVPGNARRFPETMAALAAVPGLQGAGFTVLGPHAHIPRHQGPAHSVRYLLGVKIPGGRGACRLAVGDTLLRWTEGDHILFDDRTPHEAWNDSDERRFLFFVQARAAVPGLRGVGHRATQWAFGRLTRGIARRAAQHDGEPIPDEPAPRARTEGGDHQASAAPFATLDHPPRTFRDPALQEAYESDGCLVMPFLPPAMVTELTELYWSEVAQGDDDLMAIDFDREDRGPIRMVRSLLAPRLEPLLEDLFADHRLAFVTFVAKHPGPWSNMSLHEDRTWVDERTQRSGTLWIPLVDVGPDLPNGHLQVVPGSHRLARTWCGSNTPNLLLPYFTWLRERRVSLTIPAGSALFYDSRTLHESPPNLSDAPRVAIALTMVPREAQLLHVMATGTTRRSIHAVDEEFFLRYGPHIPKRAMPEGYPVIEELDDDRSIEPAAIAAAMGAWPPPPEPVVPDDIAAAPERGWRSLRPRDDLAPPPRASRLVLEPGEQRTLHAVRTPGAATIEVIDAAPVGAGLVQGSTAANLEPGERFSLEGPVTIWNQGPGALLLDVAPAS